MRSSRLTPGMVFVLVAGLFCLLAPTWIICAAQMQKLEDEAWLQWLVRAFGLLLTGIASYFMFFDR